MNGQPDIHAFTGKIARRLKAIYPEDFSESHVNRILAMITPHHVAGPLWDEKDLVLITYGNTLTSAGEKPLITLHRFLEENLRQKASCIHILPFFPSTSDEGFAVSDYTSVSSDLGDWDDIARIGKDFSLMFDLVLNHVSTSHPWFINFCHNKSPGKDYFIEMDPGADYHKVIRPRNTPLFTPFNTVKGIKKVWTTFSADQADLNFANPDVLIEMIRIMLYYINKGVRIIRLDAVAFLWKEKGSSCLHLPQTHEVVKLLRDIAVYVNPHVIILTETNVPNTENWSYFGQRDEARMVYQFTLPPLILYTLFKSNAAYLTAWAETIPQTGGEITFLNFTASHDGIGIRPLEGTLPEKEIHLLASAIKSFGGMVSEKSNPDGTSGPYELNITYADALKGTRDGPDQFRERRFLCSQSIMLAMQGIPAVYIQSLPGASNNYEGLKETGQPRSINRKKWNVKVFKELLSKQTSNTHVFAEYLRMITVRRQIKAFHPDCSQSILRLGDEIFALARKSLENDEIVYCLSNITDHRITLARDMIPGSNEMVDLLAADKLQSVEGNFTFEAYQTRWLIKKLN